MNKDTISRGLLNALGVLVYVVLVAWTLNNFENWVGQEPVGWIIGVIPIMLFLVSACVTGSLVLLKPILLYLDGKKKESVLLFVYTVGFMAGIVILVTLFIFGAQ